MTETTERTVSYSETRKVTIDTRGRYGQNLLAVVAEAEKLQADGWSVEGSHTDFGLGNKWRTVLHVTKTTKEESDDQANTSA